MTTEGGTYREDQNSRFRIWEQESYKHVDCVPVMLRHGSNAERLQKLRLRMRKATAAHPAPLCEAHES